MVSIGIKITEFPIKHLAKTFYFVLYFHFKAHRRTTTIKIKIKTIVVNQ